MPLVLLFALAQSRNTLGGGPGVVVVGAPVVVEPVDSVECAVVEAVDSVAAVEVDAVVPVDPVLAVVGVEAVD